MIRHLLCNFIATPFVCCFYLILLQPDVIKDFFCAFLLSEYDKHQAKPDPVARF